MKSRHLATFVLADFHVCLKMMDLALEKELFVGKQWAKSLALLAYFALLNVCCLEVFMRIFVSVSAYVYSSEGRNLR